MTDNTDTARLSIRLYFANGAMFGPGKAELLTLISETGSIAAAGRKIGMSYKRAWSLVEAMNAMFAEPVVTSSRGGASHGGATITETGARVLSYYRALEAKARKSAVAELTGLELLLSVPTDAESDDPFDMSGGR